MIFPKTTKKDHGILIKKYAQVSSLVGMQHFEHK